jgi:hypothetical protein
VRLACPRAARQFTRGRHAREQRREPGARNFDHALRSFIEQDPEHQRRHVEARVAQLDRGDASALLAAAKHRDFNTAPELQEWQLLLEHDPGLVGELELGLDRRAEPVDG